jgi:hypothetical protein
MGLIRAFVFFAIGVAAVALVMTYAYKPSQVKPKNGRAHVAAQSATKKIEAAPPTPLIANLVSGLGLEDALKAIGAEPEKMEHVGGTTLGEIKKTAPKGVYRLSLDGFVHSGIEGELQLAFHDDRLTETLFYPVDAEAYLDALTREGLDIRYKRELRLSPKTLVWTEADPAGKRYVGWKIE